MEKEKGTDRTPYRVLTRGGQGELTEKKSRFIATLRPVTTEEEALAFLAEMKKKYWDARHNCYAYVIGGGVGLARCGDDGEPSGTAGRPMLEVLQGEGIRDAAAVVTRYFGGVLLGTGGLARAYSGAVKEGLRACRTGTMRYGTRLLIETDYAGAGRIQYLMGQRGITAQSVEYTDRVTIRVLLRQDIQRPFQKEVTECTGGRAVMTELEQLYYIEEDEG